MCNQRFSNWIPALPNDVFDHKYVYEEIGYNLKPIELQAAMAFIQMQKLEERGERKVRHTAPTLACNGVNYDGRVSAYVFILPTGEFAG